MMGFANSCEKIYLVEIKWKAFSLSCQKNYLDLSDESYRAVLSSGIVYYEQGGSIFRVYGWNPSVWPFQWDAEQYFHLVLFRIA